MANQTRNGKSFEYACLRALELKINNIGVETIISESKAFINAKDLYLALDINTKAKLNKAATASVSLLFRVEPKLNQKLCKVNLAIQDDVKGIQGDVRDILCSSIEGDWEIGISCKHNHKAVKHSRLSATLDFGKQWVSKPCSKDYFNEIIPIFNELNEFKKRGIKWNEIENKATRIYKPLLQAFSNELHRLDNKFPNEVPSNLLKYILGTSDFYKLIADDASNTSTLQVYNLFGTLNEKTSIEKPRVKVGQLKLPHKLFDISFKEGSENTLIIVFDEGWTLSLRIHSASTIVEPSLKFDIQLIGVPQSLVALIEHW